MSIFSVVILGIEALILYNVKSAKTNEFEETAIYKAEELINYLISLPYNNSSLGIGNYTCCINGRWCDPSSDEEECCSNDIENFVGNNDFWGNYSIEYSVNQLDGTDARKITVTIKFRTDNFTLEQLKGNWQWEKVLL